MKEFLTNSQHSIIRGCLHARNNAVPIGIVCSSGVGMKYALSIILRDYPYEKIIYADAHYSGAVSEICVALITVCTNVRFSNLNYKRTELFDLVRILKDRMKKDVKGKPLIVIDNMWALSNVQIKYFNNFLTIYGDTCGIVFRTTQRSLRKYQNAYPEDFAKFYNETVSEWLVLEQNSPKEMAQFILAHGINDKSFIEELTSRTRSFSYAMKYIEKFLKASKNNS